jgi:hypothetical protein
MGKSTITAMPMRSAIKGAGPNSGTAERVNKYALPQIRDSNKSSTTWRNLMGGSGAKIQGPKFRAKNELLAWAKVDFEIRLSQSNIL